MSKVKNRNTLPNIQCLVLGGGPSTDLFMKSYNPDLQQLPKIGCGDVSSRYDLDAYCLGDPRRKPNLPVNDKTVVYAHQFVWEPRMIRWQDEWPHGGSSGGMAVSVACMNYDSIGLMGFDGYPTDGFENYDNFVACFKTNIIGYWLSKGKKLYSLMPDSIFNELLLEYKY